VYQYGAKSPDRETQGSKQSTNLRIWVPAAVAGAAVIALLLFVFRGISRRRNDDDGRRTMIPQTVQSEDLHTVISIK
jgi:hypothetical protein